MARGGKKDANAAAAAAAAPPDPQADERKRLKRLAISKNMLSDAPAKACSAALSPSKIVAKHHGRDILKKSQRKNKFLFSFPGLLAPIAGGKIGELKDLGTKNPILYLDFPQGQMKLFGTIVYPKTRYLTLQFSRGGKNVMCEDYFDTVIVFSDAWWIGRKDENPEETRLEFPKELNESQGQQAEYNFKGGAGGACGKQQSAKPTKKCVEPESPKHELDDLSDSQNDLKEKVEVTPARHSARTAGRRFKFSEASSGDESPENNIETSEEEKEIGLEDPTKSHSSTKKMRMMQQLKRKKMLKNQLLLLQNLLLFKLPYQRCSRKWRKRFKDPRKKEMLARKEKQGKVHQGRNKASLRMMTLKSFQACQRILNQVMKIGLLQIRERC